MEQRKNNEKKLIKILGKITGQTKLKELQRLKDEGKLTEEEFKKLKNKLFIKICTIEVMLLILIPMLVVGAFSIKQNIDNKRKIAAEEARLAAQVEVPDVKGMTIDKAKEALNNIGLNIKLTDYDKKQTEEKPNEYVVDTQYPSANEKVDKNTEVSLYFKELMTMESDNFYGMRFKKTIPEFCESYNKALENIYEYLGEDTKAIGLYTLKSTDFSYYNTDTTTNLKQYNAKGLNYTISLFTENNSEYIVYASVGYIPSSTYNGDKLMTLVSTKIYPAIGKALTGLPYQSILNNFTSISEEKQYTYFKDNICYIYRENGTVDYMYVIATSEERYKQDTEGTRSTQDTSSAANQSEAIEDIKQRISFFNSYYGYNFQPTDEQMEELVEFYNTFNETGDYGNDSLLSFLKQKGWIDTSSTNDNSNSVQQSNTTSSNKNNSSSQNTNDKTNKSEDIVATLNVNLKQLIANNTTAQEIKAESSRIDIHIYVEGCLVENGYFEYFDGGDSLPDTITDKATVLEYKKKPSEKRKVKITMDNTRTAIKETTLFEGEMVFDTTKTYEIK